MDVVDSQARIGTVHAGRSFRLGFPAQVIVLKLAPPLLPMEAQSVAHIPTGEGWQYEPKWDGFRCLAFRDGRNVELQSKSGQPLGRYFPELVGTFLALGSEHFILDGEIAVPVQGRFSFDDLLQRIHPANSRVERLAREHPAIFVAFDLLAGSEPLLKKPLRERRKELERFASKQFMGSPRLKLSPATTDVAVAKRWFRTVGGDLDGIVAKRLDYPYMPGERTGMEKIKLT